MIKKSYAKINLILEILGKLDNGFHEISSVVQTIDLYDTIIFKQSNHISLKCNIKALENENNLIIKTIKLLKKKIQLPWRNIDYAKQKNTYELWTRRWQQ